MAPRSEDSNLTTRIINFELVQPVSPHGTSTLRTDRRTDDLRRQYRALHNVRRAAVKNKVGHIAISGCSSSSKLLFLPRDARSARRYCYRKSSIRLSVRNVDVGLPWAYRLD